MTREEFEKKKHWLNRYKKNKRILNNLREKLYVLENRLSSAKTVFYSDSPKVRNTKTINDYLSEKESLENRICNFEKKKEFYITR